VAGERIGNGLLTDSERMFGWWHRVRDGTLKRSTFIVCMRLVQRRVESLNRSTSATTHEAFGDVVCHSAKASFVVRTIARFFSCRRATRPDVRLRAAWRGSW